MTAATPQFSNRLKQETSPYLLQHAHNPVDWYPWGPEALERARQEDKPIFLSIGYSACHWCHVMEHESFEDPATAAVMNEHFVNIKVDREERPDLDHIYMAAVQMMTRHGGWPMSVFLTPELEPFYGGTYFPPEPRHGMPSFTQVLQGVAEAWRSRRDEINRSAGQLVGALRQMNHVDGSGKLEIEMVDRAVRALAADYDPGYGGFGTAPKFPHPMDLKLCLRHWKRSGAEQSLEMVEHSLDHMARGGIYDHLGGGFHRYSTDERWLVPHFEKMLYDNALLAQTYLEAYQARRNPEFARVARETLDYVLREMTAPEGGFYSTQDADSEGVEGKYFVWSLAETREVLGGEAAELFAYVYDVSEGGNWEETNILNRPKTLEQCARLLGKNAAELERSVAESRAKLFQVRGTRVAPGRDDKVLVAWNGLMIDAMARGYQVLGDERYLEAARRAAEFILTLMWSGNAESGGDSSRRLLHAYKDGRARFNAYLDDYAALVDGLVSLFESDFDSRWLSAASQIADVMIDQFWDESDGGFYYMARDHERLVTRVRDVHDSATPSGNSMATFALLRLGRLMGNEEWSSRAERSLKSFAELMVRVPRAAGQMLIALDFLLGDRCEIALLPGDGGVAAADTRAALDAIRQRFIPNKVVACGADIETPLLADKKAVDRQVTVYVCRNYSCAAPLVGLDAIRAGLVAL